MKDEEMIEEIEVSETTETKEPLTFEDLGVCEELCQAVKKMGWTAPTGIQKDSIPYALQGKDIIALAETGSGKTGAFAIPVVQSLLGNPQRFYCLALSPTRELCVQIGEQFKALGSGISLQVCVILGGIDMVSQSMQLAQKPHVIVASPGRLVDHLENTKGFHLKNLQYLIMDEADRLLSEDFDEALDKIVTASNKDRRTYLFSATMTSKVAKLQRASLRNPVKIEVSSKYDTAKKLVQSYLFQPWKYKTTWFCSVVSHYSHYSMVVFTDTCANTQKMANILRNLGFSATALHGQMSQAYRLGALNSFKAGQKKILVATDVASRGLDIPGVDLVINLDIPKTSKDYIHRVGRTARAGRSGRAITIISQYDVEAFQRIEHALGKQLAEFKDISEETAMALHDRVQEASRQSEMADREKDDQWGGGFANRTVKKLLNKNKGQGGGNNKKGNFKKGGKKHK